MTARLASVTEIVLIRHGQTDYNLEFRFQGQIDVPLNALGLEQARRVSGRLAAERVDALYCSDLTRTRQTAAPSGELLAMDPVALAALREQHFGLLEGLVLAEVVERHPEHWERWSRHDPDYAVPGGESVREFHARAVAAIRDLARRHPGESLAVVTHGGVLDMIWRAARGLPLRGPRACEIPNAGFNRIRVAGETIEIVAWADDAHVADLTA
jgi:2,3-bisphosphoglycerate-dependent phosphoglycerate mutase